MNIRYNDIFLLLELLIPSDLGFLNLCLHSGILLFYHLCMPLCLGRVPHIFVQIYSYQMARACVSWLQQ